MKVVLQQSLGILALTIGISACSTAPFPWQRTERPVSRAPIVDRTARQPMNYPAQAPLGSPDFAPVPQEDTSLPREYATAPAYPAESNAQFGQPASPYMPAETYQPPPLPPGAAAYPSTSRAIRGALPEPQPVVSATRPVRPPAPPIPPPSPPPMATGTPAPANPTVAVTSPPPPPPPPPDPDSDPNPPAVAPPPRPSQTVPPAVQPANLPPAEIARDGNQAVVALLDNAAKYVKSNELGKAGAALERALRIEPRNAGIWHDLAQVRLHQGKYQQAESLANKSINLAGDNRTLQARNWTVISAARKASGNIAGAEEAEARASQLSH